MSGNASARKDKENQQSPQMMRGQKKLAGGFMIRRGSKAQLVEEKTRLKHNFSSQVDVAKDDIK